MDKIGIGLAVDPTEADLSRQPGGGPEAENPHAGSENRTGLTCRSISTLSATAA